jgi:hypothetical protein
VLTQGKPSSSGEVAVSGLEIKGDDGRSTYSSSRWQREEIYYLMSPNSGCTEAFL